MKERIEKLENDMHTDDNDFLFYLKYPLTNITVSKLLFVKKKYEIYKI